MVTAAMHIHGAVIPDGAAGRKKRGPMMSTDGPIVNRRAMPRLTMDAMVRGNRDITAATTSDLAAGVVVCSETFPASGEQIASARAFLNAHLKDHPARHTAVLLATEIATNAVRHSGTRFFGLSATRIAGGCLRIVVIDEGRAGIPHLQDKSADAESGRGMTIVDTLAKRWGVVRRPGVGVAVWFECAT